MNCDKTLVCPSCNAVLELQKSFTLAVVPSEPVTPAVEPEATTPENV